VLPFALRLSSIESLLYRREFSQLPCGLTWVGPGTIPCALTSRLRGGAKCFTKWECCATS
jgi:hypothetical protein